MNRLVALLAVLGLSLAVGISGRAAEVNPEQAKATAEIENLGGMVYFDSTNPNDPVKRVELIGTDMYASSNVMDAALAHLKSFTELQVLRLECTSVTDAGLENLKGLTDLRWLALKDTKVTDKGVKKLQQALPNCRISRRLDGS